MNAYLSSVPSFSDGGSGLSVVGGGCCGEGSSNKPANDRDRGREHQRARTRFTLAGFRRIAGMQRSLPRRGAATHHACPAWYPFRAPSSPRSGAGGQEFDLPGLSILANVRLLLLMLFSPEPSGKPAGPNSHTRRAASFAYSPPTRDAPPHSQTPPLHLESQQDPTATQDAPPHLTPSL